MVAAAKHVEAGRDEVAAQVLDALLTSTTDEDDAREGLSARIFASALARRLGHQLPAANLYLRNLDVAQISLFNLLATQPPPVRLAGVLANELIAGFVADRDSPVLFDVGIGTAQQEVALLRELARRDRLPRRLHVVALEPSPSSLSEAERNLAAVAKELDVDISVTPISGLAEDLNESDWDDLAPIVRGGVVNAAFAVHHVQSTGAGPVAAREALFGSIRRLEPAVIVLAEPNGDHLEPTFVRRVENCIWHFGTLFRLIDRLPIDRRERAAMKLFFAREIDDIVANDEATRAERHEWTATWLARLSGTGFSPFDALPFEPTELADGFDTAPRAGHIGLRFDGETLVSVIAAAAEDTTIDGAGWIDTRDPDAGLDAVAPVPTSVSVSASASVRVGDVMTSDGSQLRLGDRLDQAARVIATTGASDVAVVDDAGQFVGVLSEGDVIRLLMPDSGEIDAASPVELFEVLAINGRVRATETIDPLVIRDAVYLTSDDDLLRAADLMISRQIRRLPVIDDGRLVGTLSRADLCHALLCS